MWQAPDLADQNGIIIGYAINVTQVGSGQSYQVTSNTNTLYLDSLLPFTTYTCRIAAMTSVGVGPYSIAVSFLTDEAGVSRGAWAFLGMQSVLHIIMGLQGWESLV